jgi:signal transduction histidine kinase
VFLLVMALLVLIPLAVLSGAIWFTASNTLSRQAMDRLNAEITQRQTQLEHWLDSLTAQLYTLSLDDPALTDSLMAHNLDNTLIRSANSRFNNALSTGAFSELILANWDNRLLTATNPDRLTLPDRACITRVICIFGPFSESSRSGSHVWLGIQYPILDTQSQAAGELIGLVDARRLDPLLGVQRNQLDPLVYLIDENDSMYWLPGYGAIPNAHVSIPALSRNVGFSAPVTYPNLSGAAVEGVTAYIPLLNAWLIVEQPLSQINEPLALLPSLAAGLGALALAAILIAGRLIFKPVEHEQTSLRDQLAVKDRALAELRNAGLVRNQAIADMSHELRTSLSATLNFSGFLLDGLFGPLTADQTEPTSQIHDSAQHLLSLINDLLDVAKVEAGQMQMFKTDFNPEPLFEQTVATVRALTLGKDVTIQTDFPRNWPVLHADRRRVLQILLNLVANAAKFTDQGTITLRAHVLASRFEVRVEDSGAGIDPADVATVFEPYRQGHNATLLEKGGTGLGLPLSRIFARMHDGDVSYEPGALGGSTFIFWLPL